MLTLPFVLLELLFVLLKPQEMYPQLQAFAPLYTLPSLIVLGFFFDSGRFLLAARRISLAPYAPYAVGFLVWCVLTLARKPDKIVPDLLQLTTALLIGLGIAHGAQTWKKFYTVTGAMLLLTLFLAFVGDHQHFAPTRCFFMYEDSDLPLQYDGRLCGSTGAIHDGEIDAEECYLGETDPERHYICAHAGLMETSSVGERVRFRGILEDPNELSLTIALGVPMSFALFQRKKTALRGLLVALTLGLVGACIVFTQSRGGQLVILAVLGTYFIRRAGFGKGIIAAAVAAVPVLMLGGRSGDSADESATERMELLQLGISYVREHPILGVGKGQFSSTNVEINGLTAHNSYLLCASELGMPGMLIWSVVMYLAMKIPLSALRQLEGVAGDEADRARVWAGALIASQVGLTVGVFFLSFAYHPLLWTYVGLSGAYYAVVRAQLPNWRVRVTRGEIAALAAANVTILVLIFVYSKIKLG